MFMIPESSDRQSAETSKGGTGQTERNPRS